MIFGCIADDFTGATDLCSSLHRAGQRTYLVTDLHAAPLAIPDVDVVVVALKSRAVEPELAVALSLEALDWLQRVGATRCYFKYCSTFDSTSKGNIGPVLDALADALAVRTTVVCPAHPEQGRTIYQGHLFVGTSLLAESPMANHPINPMRDSNVLRLMRAQTLREVTLLPYDIVMEGPCAIRTGLDQCAAEGVSYVVVDALDVGHLRAIAEACSDAPLLSGGAGVGWALGAILNPASRPSAAEGVDPSEGPTVILAGSSSAATRGQISRVLGRVPCLKFDPLAIVRQETSIEGILNWVLGNLDEQGIVVYASDDPERVGEIQGLLGTECASTIVEETLGAVARSVVAGGVRRLVLAGGETSAAIVRELGVGALEICEDLEPGIPWMRSADERALVFALKSGNFGSDALFEKALGITS